MYWLVEGVTVPVTVQWLYRWLLDQHKSIKGVVTLQKQLKLICRAGGRAGPAPDLPNHQAVTGGDL